MKNGNSKPFDKLVTLVLLAICIVLAVAVLIGMFTKEEEVQVQTTNASTAINVGTKVMAYEPFVRTTHVNGEVSSYDNDVAILPDTAGTVTSVFVRRGDIVDEGEVIAMIDASVPGARYKESPVVAKVAGDFANKNNIRFIIDIQDLWPEAFEMVFKVPVLKDIIFYPMRKKADKIYSMANSIVAVSNTYADRAGIVNKNYEEKLAIYLGTNLDYFDNAHKKNEIVIFDDVIRVAYIGTLGHSYDLKCVINAFKLLHKKDIKNILLVVMGSGPLKEEFEKYAKDNNVNSEFLGRLDYEEMVGYLCACNIAVNPISKGAAQSIINKVGDYAAAGLPVINTQESVEYRKLVEDYQIGFNIENGNSEELAEAIEYLYKNEDLRRRLGENNRKLAEEKFDRKVTYLKIKELIESK